MERVRRVSVQTTVKGSGEFKLLERLSRSYDGKEFKEASNGCMSEGESKYESPNGL